MLQVSEGWGSFSLLPPGCGAAQGSHPGSICKLPVLFHVTQPLPIATGARGAAREATGPHCPATGPWPCRSKELNLVVLKDFSPLLRFHRLLRASGAEVERLLWWWKNFHTFQRYGRWDFCAVTFLQLQLLICKKAREASPLIHCLLGRSVLEEWKH